MNKFKYFKMNNFSRAGRAEILRAAQKDDEFCDQLVVQVSDFVGDVAGMHTYNWNTYIRIQHTTSMIKRIYLRGTLITIT